MCVSHKEGWLWTSNKELSKILALIHFLLIVRLPQQTPILSRQLQPNKAQRKRVLERPSVNIHTIPKSGRLLLRVHRLCRRLARMML